jgi:hypothetical protein
VQDPKDKSKPFFDHFNLNEHADFLVLEFKVQEEAPKINILPPAPPPPPPPEKLTVSVAVQTLPVEVPPPQRKPEREKEDKLEKS